MTEDTAGRSAWAEYERRRADRGRRRSRPRLALRAGAVAVAAAGGVGLVGAGTSRLLSLTVGVGLPGPLEREAVMAAALIGAVWVVTGAMRSPRETESWRTGAEGEEQTAAALAPLSAEGWRVLHDRRLPHSPANVDHIVVGPPGVWVIETKAWHGRVVFGADRLRRNGQAADAVFDQLWRQADAITAAASSVLGLAGLTVRPVLCLPRATLVDGRDSSGRLVRGSVEVHQPDSLARRLRLAEPVLTAAQVDAAVALIDRALPPAGPGRRGVPNAGQRRRGSRQRVPGQTSPPPRANANAPASTTE